MTTYADGDVVVGIDVLVKVNGTIIGAQKNATLSLKSKEMDGGHKSNGGWDVSLAGNLGWSVSCNALLAVNDAVQKVLLQKWMSRDTVTVNITEPGGDVYEGAARVMSIEKAYPKDEVATYVVQLGGVGALSMTI